MRRVKHHPVRKFVAGQRANEQRSIAFAKASAGSICVPDIVG